MYSDTMNVIKKVKKPTENVLINTARQCCASIDGYVYTQTHTHDTHACITHTLHRHTHTHTLSIHIVGEKDSIAKLKCSEKRNAFSSFLKEKTAV